MSSPATVSEYGKFIDLQHYAAAAPTTSGSLFLSGTSAAGFNLRTNVGVKAAGQLSGSGAGFFGSDIRVKGAGTFGSNVTAVGSFIIGSADMSEADLEKLDDITNGTVAASKAVVVDANKDASGFRNVTATGAVTAGSFVIGSANISEAELETIDDVTAGTVAASKAVVVDSNKDISSFRNLTATGAVTAGSFVIGSADINEAELETIDGVTAGTVAASKAVVVDSNKDADGFRNVTMTGDMTAGTITMTGFTVDADGDTALKSLLVDDSSTIGCDSDTDLMSLAAGALTVNGTLSADTSFTLDAVTLDATELGYLDGVTAGTAAASKALVLDANKRIGSLTSLTASHIKVDTLDVNTINSVTTTANDLEVSDRRIIAALSSTSANADGGGLRIGGDASTDGHAAMLWSHSDSALALSIGSTDIAFVHAGGLDPGADNSFDLGGASNEWKDLYLDGVAYIDELRADQLGAALDANSQNITGVGTFSAAGATVTSLSVTDGNITNVGDIALDSISADGTEIDISLTDNRSAALEIKESSNVYMSFSTANGEEGIVVKKEMELEQGALIFDDKELQFATDEGGVGASGSLKYVSASDVFQISGSKANGLKLLGDIDASGYAFQAAAGVLTSLSVSDGNITNVGSLACDSITVDAAGVGLDIQFGGNTGLNKLTLTDNLASALDVNEGGTSYLKFVTTNGNEGVEFGKEAEFKAGGIVADDQAMVFGDDDDGSIAFISAANVVRFDGGSAGLHFNDTSAFGADGSGKDVSFHGAAANELMKYTAADHTLKFVNASSATILTLGGDATSEFAVDVADGSNNQNKIRAAAFVTYSDERLKTDVAPMQNGLETINNLKAVNFTWKKDGVRDFGFMAQELKQVVPQAVHGTEEGLLGVDYGRLSAILVSAIQEQSAQIASLKKQLENK